VNSEDAAVTDPGALLRGRRALVSYIFPVFNEEKNIEPLFGEVTRVTDSEPGYDYEFIFVDDGSQDGSLATLRELAVRDDRVRVIDFSRNFGHQIAVTAGIDYSRGDAVIVMDTDLQDPPEVSLSLIRASYHQNRLEEGVLSL